MCCMLTHTTFTLAAGMLTIVTNTSRVMPTGNLPKRIEVPNGAGRPLKTLIKSMIWKTKWDRCRRHQWSYHSLMMLTRSQTLKTSLNSLNQSLLSRIRMYHRICRFPQISTRPGSSIAKWKGFRHLKVQELWNILEKINKIISHSSNPSNKTAQKNLKQSTKIQTKI